MISLTFRYGTRSDTLGEVDSLSNIPVDDLCVGDIYTYQASEYVYTGKNSNKEWVNLPKFKEWMKL